jgi:ethanolamine permease
MGRVGLLPGFIGFAHRTTWTPVNALLLNAVLGIAAILFLDTARLITLSAMGAAVLYVVAMLSLIRLRRTEPDLVRPYRAPLYPWLPLIALSLAALCFCIMAWTL